MLTLFQDDNPHMTEKCRRSKRKGKAVLDALKRVTTGVKASHATVAAYDLMLKGDMIKRP